MTLQSWLHQENFTITGVEGVKLVREVRCQNLKGLRDDYCSRLCFLHSARPRCIRPPPTLECQQGKYAKPTKNATTPKHAPPSNAAEKAQKRKTNANANGYRMLPPNA